MKSKKLSYKKILVLFSIIVVSVLMTGCNGGSPPIIKIFSASPSTINQGESSTLTWSVSDADTVTITPGVGKVDSSGIISVYPGVTTVYTLTATNSAGSVTASATVTVIPLGGPIIKIFSASPSTINQGESSTLTWSVSDADKVTINPWVGPITSSGSTTVSPVVTTIYTLTATNSAGSVTASANINVQALPVHNLTKNTYYNTIQAALDDADNDNTIEVADGTYDETIDFPSDKKIILQSVNGPSSTIIRGDDRSSTIILDSSLSGTTIEGFTITHAVGLMGYGIFNDSNLTIYNCVVSGNSWYSGGGIYNSGGGTLTITSSTISGNSARYNGGGIRNLGTLTITGASIISDNTAGDLGGGILNRAYSTLTITSSTISGNSAGINGGGILNGPYSTLTITSSTISGNSAAGHHGGGIYNTAYLTITSSTISGNTARNFGGGICNRSPASSTITASTISGNSAAGHQGGGIYNSGGGTLTITSSTISGNTAAIYGGGIYNSDYSTLNITSSTISDNSIWTRYYCYGGGIYNSGTLTITGSIISGNYARADSYDAEGVWGGGIYNSGGTLNITASTISGNSAWANCYDAWGGIYLSSSETITIGGDIADDKNTICGNYKTGVSPSFSMDQQIRDDFGSLYGAYKDTNNISVFCQ